MLGCGRFALQTAVRQARSTGGSWPTSIGRESAQRRYLYDPQYESEADLARRKRQALGLGLNELTVEEMRSTLRRMADEQVTAEQELEEHHGSDLFSAFESLGQEGSGDLSDGDEAAGRRPEDEEDDLDVILEGLPRLTTKRFVTEGTGRVSIPQISALSYAIGFVGHWQQKLCGEVMNLDEWQFEERWLPGYYSGALAGSFFLDLDKALLGKSTPDPWMSELLESWLCGRLGWTRHLDPSKVGPKSGEPTSFGFLCLPFAAFSELSGEEIGTPVDDDCDEPTPKVIARRLSHRYITSERVHRSIVFSPKSDLDSPNTPATAWVRAPAWQNAVIKTYFGDYLGYQVRFNPSNEEVLIRAPPEKMIDAVERVVNALQQSSASASSSSSSSDSESAATSASGSTRVSMFPSLPINPPLDVHLSRDSILTGDLQKSRNITKTCHLDLWILSRIFHWMNHVRSFAKNLKGATPLRLADGSTVFALDIGRIEESWQELLARRWLQDTLGWTLLLNDPLDTSYAYFSHNLLTSNYEYFVSFPPASLSFAQLTPGHLAWITIQRELALEIRNLCTFIETNSWTKLSDCQYNFQRPISKWMRPVVAAFFEKFLGYTLVWSSARRVTLLPSPRAMQEAVSVLIGRKELEAAFHTMAEHATVGVEENDDDSSESDEDISSSFNN